MTGVYNQATAEPLHATSVIDCHRALLTIQVYSWLTVVTISGEIDAANADQLNHHMVSVVPHDGAVIVDMVETDFIGIDGLRALFALNMECMRTDTKWALIASHAVHRLLRVGDREQLIPAVRSATEALHRVRRARRRLQLVK